jgi:hypothetical protein
VVDGINPPGSIERITHILFHGKYQQHAFGSSGLKETGERALVLVHQGASMRGRFQSTALVFAARWEGQDLSGVGLNRDMIR